MIKFSILALVFGVSTFCAEAAAAQSEDLVQHGAYLARLADCVACHTAPGGKPFAGGLRMETPIGAIYSSNITPDRNSGIGSYSYLDFEKAVRRGVTPAGSTLYPAMPYPSYARISDQDMQALYAYFMKGVPAVAQPNRPVDIPWPMSMRWPLTIWRKAFVPDYLAPAVNSTSDAQVRRGAYRHRRAGHDENIADHRHWSSPGSKGERATQFFVRPYSTASFRDFRFLRLLARQTLQVSDFLPGSGQLRSRHNRFSCLPVR